MLKMDIKVPRKGTVSLPKESKNKSKYIYYSSVTHSRFLGRYVPTANGTPEGVL